MHIVWLVRAHTVAGGDATRRPATFTKCGRGGPRHSGAASPLSAKSTLQKPVTPP
jgi:hypothetical protein